MLVTISQRGRTAELWAQRDPHSFYSVLRATPDEGVLGAPITIASEDGAEVSAGSAITGRVTINGRHTSGQMLHVPGFPQSVLGWRQLRDLGLMPPEADFVVHVPPVLIGGRDPGAFQETYLKRRLIGDARRVIASWERQGLVERCASVCSAAVSLSLKPNGKVQIHFDYSDLNAGAEQEPPHPRMDRPRAFELLTLGRFYSVFRLFYAEWRIPLDTYTKYKTAFTFLGRQYVWNRLPGNYRNTSSRLSAALEKVLGLLPQNMKKRVTYYYDTILISADTEDEGRAFSNKLWLHLEQNSFEMRGRQCQMCQPVVQFLGREISEEGVRLGKDFIRKVENMRAPRNARELRSMLGCLNDAAQYTPGFGLYSGALYKLTGKTREFYWDSDAEAALRGLRGQVLGSGWVVPGLAAEEPCTVRIHVRGEAWMAQILNADQKPYRFASGLLRPLKTKEERPLLEIKAMREVCKQHGRALQGRDVEWEVESPQIRDDPRGALRGKRLNIDFLQNQRYTIKVVPARSPPTPWPETLP